MLAAGCGDNLAAECETAADCPGLDSECLARACLDDHCTPTVTEPGFVLSSQIAGDCYELRCDGNGNVESAPIDDRGDDNNPCTIESCANGRAESSFAVSGAPCGTALECDGAGQCVGCLTATECPGTDNECQTRTCSTGGMCGVAYAVQGTPRTTQIDHDCALIVCNGAGGSATDVDDSDLPVDGNPCTDDVCTAGAPSNAPFDSTTGCGTGMVCDGTGSCDPQTNTCGRAMGWTAGAVAADTDGTVLVAGYYVGPATFGAGEPAETTLQAPVGLFVARYRASDSTLVWVRSVDGADNNADGNNGGLGIAVRGGVIYVAGSFTGSVTFGPGESNQTAFTTTEIHAFLARYAADGSLVWVRRASGAWVQGTSVAVSPDGTVYTAGYVDEGDGLFGAGEPGQATVTAPPSPIYFTRAMFLARYQADGSFIRVKSTSASQMNTSAATTMAATVDGGAVVAGTVTGTVTFGEANQKITMTASSFDAFVARYNADGSLAWAKKAGGNGTDGARGVAVSADATTIRVVGYFGSLGFATGTGTATFGAGESGQVTLSAAGQEGYSDIFVAAFNGGDGTLAWVKRAGGVGFDFGENIALDSTNGSVVTGAYGGGFPEPLGTPAVFGEGAAQIVLAAGSVYEVFIARYDATGTLTWALKGAGPTDYDQGYGVALTADNTVTTVGRFFTSMTFDPGQPDACVLTTQSEGGAAFLTTFTR